ncbi:MAG: tRNA (guanine-N(7)-)-methyltransferase [Planctomycetota bacterium]|nr:MAG: tRNA (guanine-N(7)-)-methyltransferase [Planctomycetota bacterium]
MGLKRTQQRREIILGGPLYLEPAGLLEPVAVFGRRAPLLVDVGAARARYFLNVAPQLPQVDFLGIEVSKKRVEAALARLARRGITNCRMVWGDATRVLAEHLAPGSAAAITVLFPDPWPKRRHARRRLLHRPEVVRLLAERLAPGGLLWFKTDDPAYFEEAQRRLAAEPLLAPADGLRVALPGLAPFDLDLPEPTYYEQLWQQQGRRIHGAAWRRR